MNETEIEMTCDACGKVDTITVQTQYLSVYKTVQYYCKECMENPEVKLL